jgi:hypothetical protein
MFWHSRKADERYVHLGRLNCPRAGGDVDIDVCYGCRFMQEMREHGAMPFVRCAPAAATPAEAIYRLP